MKTYEQWRTILNSRPKKKGFDTPKPYKADNNTFVDWAADGTPDIVIRLHQNPIVTLHMDGTVTLNDAGWRTSTTRNRINAFSPFYVTSVWEVRVGAKFMQFKDGMNIRQIPA